MLVHRQGLDLSLASKVISVQLGAQQSMQEPGTKPLVQTQP